ncbi:MAG TPA: hypothetical protein VJR47_05845 [Stellaceae bacterium]|nr:hypothetical protein [Stellaceae bacterium]
MRVFLAAVLAASVAAPAFAAGQITCSQIPAAQRFVSGLKPGPNTREAQRYLDQARKAKTDKDCVTALGHVNYYAKRSAAADKRLENPAHGRKQASPAQPKPGKPSSTAKPGTLPARAVKSAPTGPVPARKPPLPIKCADPLHQDRPGGSDYHGPPVPGCRGIL